MAKVIYLGLIAFFDKSSIIPGFLAYDKLLTPYDEDNVK